MRTSPGDALIEVLLLASDVWLPRADIECPISDRDSDMVEAAGYTISAGSSEIRSIRRLSCGYQPTSNLHKVVLCDPGLPVLLHQLLGLSPRLVLSPSPLVDDAVVSGLCEEVGLWMRSVQLSLHCVASIP